MFFYTGVGLLLLLLVGVRDTTAQDYDFSAPIKCVHCNGTIDNKNCTDPFSEGVLDKEHSGVKRKQCDKGMCLKYTIYNSEGKLVMHRGCSRDIDFHLTMIDGVCRTERNGNGYLCMCGKSMCNSAQKVFIPEMGWTASQQLSIWLTFGVLFLFPHWVLLRTLVQGLC